MYLCVSFIDIASHSLCEKYNFYDLLLDNSLQGVDVHGLLQVNFVLSVTFL